MASNRSTLIGLAGVPSQLVSGPGSVGLLLVYVRDTGDTPANLHACGLYHRCGALSTDTNADSTVHIGLVNLGSQNLPYRCTLAQLSTIVGSTYGHLAYIVVRPLHSRHAQHSINVKIHVGQYTASLMPTPSVDKMLGTIYKIYTVCGISFASVKGGVLTGVIKDDRIFGPAHEVVSPTSPGPDVVQANPRGESCGGTVVKSDLSPPEMKYLHGVAKSDDPTSAELDGVTAQSCMGWFRLVKLWTQTVREMSLGGNVLLDLNTLILAVNKLEATMAAVNTACDEPSPIPLIPEYPGLKVTTTLVHPYTTINAGLHFKDMVKIQYTPDALYGGGVPVGDLLAILQQLDARDDIVGSTHTAGGSGGTKLDPGQASVTPIAGTDDASTLLHSRLLMREYITGLIADRSGESGN